MKEPNKLKILWEKFNRFSLFSTHPRANAWPTENFLDTLIENLPDMIFVKDAQDLRFVLFNKAGEELLGYRREDLVGKNDYDFFPKEQADYFTAKDRAVVEGKQVVDILEEPIDTRSGPRILHTKKIPIFDTQGNPLYLLGISEDITEKKKHEEERLNFIREQGARAEAERALERLSMLSDAMPSIVWMADQFGAISYFNRRWFEYTGFAKRESLQLDILQVIHSDQRDEFVRRWQQAVEEQSLFQFQALLRRADGIYRWHIMRALPYRDENGAFVSWYGTFTDTDEQKHAEQKLQEAIKIRDEFLSVASHELKTPITSLQMQIQMLQLEIKRGQAPSAERVAEALSLAVRQIQRLSGLIEDLLDVSRIQAGRLSINPTLTDLTRLTRDLVERFRAQAESAGSSLSWTRCDEVQVPCDRFRMEQVFTNLLSNAIKYGAGHPIELSLEMGRNRVRFRVTDHGIGIDEHSRSKIFKRFSRAVSSRNFGGLGLGLYIARQIVLAHGGKIYFDSECQRATCFTVELPAQQSLRKSA